MEKISDEHVPIEGTIGESGDFVVIKKISIKDGMADKTNKKVGRKVKLVLFSSIKAGEPVQKLIIRDSHSGIPINKHIGVTRNIKEITRDEETGNIILETTTSFYSLHFPNAATG